MKNKELLISEISNIMGCLSFPEEAQASLSADMLKITENGSAYADFLSVRASYDESADIDYTAALAKMKTVDEATGVHEYACNMLMFLSMCGRLRERYAERELSDGLFIDTVRDLKFKVVECKLVYGVWGTFVPQWFVRFFRDIDRFFFTRLQFEPYALGYDCSVDGVELKKGTKALNVHIPRTETRLDHGEVLESYRRAAEFYADFFGEDPVIFTCKSWLLFPKHDEMLKPGSNMLLFAHDYTIVYEGVYDDGADLWRTFDTMYNGNPDDLPANTTIRRAYVDMLKRGEKLGFAHGVFVYEKLAEKQNLN